MCAHVACVYLSSCPAGHLRHRAYCVLCSCVSKFSKKMNPQNEKNYQKQASKIEQKSSQIDARRGPWGSWGRFWDHFGSRGCPRGVPGTPGAEKVTKSSPILRCFLVFWAPPNHTFSVFFRFLRCLFGDIFWERFWKASGHHFWRILEWFSICFFVFFWRCWAGLGSKKNIVLYCNLQCFWNIDLFEKSGKMKKIRIILCMFFWKAVGTSFLRFWGPFGLHFGRLRGPKVEKKRFRRGVKKQLWIKSCGNDKKSRECPPPGGGFP